MGKLREKQKQATARDRIYREMEEKVAAERAQDQKAFFAFLDECEARIAADPQSPETQACLGILLQVAQHSHRQALPGAWRSADPYENWRRADAAGRLYLHGAFPGFWEAFEALGTGNAGNAQPLVDFLEADPHFFRSGYLAIRCIPLVRRFSLTATQREQLVRAVLKVVDKGDRREFRHYCSLARTIDNPTLRDGLLPRMASEDKGIRRRAGWMLGCVLI